MIDGINASLAGMQKYAKAIDKNAQNIANPPATQDASGNSIPDDSTKDIVDLSTNAIAFKANAKALEVQQRVQDELLKIDIKA